MSKFLICAVLDEAVGAFGPPMIFRSKMEAIRGFSDAVADKNSAMHAHPSDFCLYHVGVWDDQSAICDSVSPLVRLIGASECGNAVTS